MAFPHEMLEYPRDSTEGILLSIELLANYREEERDITEREQKRSPKIRQGQSKGNRIAKKHPSRVKNLPKKRR